MAQLFGGGPKPPAVPPPVPMPDLESPEVLAARRNIFLKANATSGRASTNLTGGSDYSSSKLGTA